MKYLFVTLMWNGPGRNARAGRYFCGLLSVLQPEWNDAVRTLNPSGRHERPDAVDKRCCLPQHHGTGNSKAAKRDSEYGSGDLPRYDVLVLWSRKE